MAGAGRLGGALRLPLLPVHPRVGRHRRHAAGVDDSTFLPPCIPLAMALDMLVFAAEQSRRLWRAADNSEETEDAGDMAWQTLSTCVSTHIYNCW